MYFVLGKPLKLRILVVCVYEMLTDEGLAAMSDCQDMTTALARELTQGIEGEVEDLGEVFKRMALLKPQTNIIDGEATVVETTIETPAAQIAKQPAKPKRPVHSSGGLLALARQTPKKPAKKKPVAVLEGQMNLFDFLENTA
jgi:hypothetical protein